MFGINQFLPNTYFGTVSSLPTYFNPPILVKPRSVKLGSFTLIGNTMDSVQVGHSVCRLQGLLPKPIPNIMRKYTRLLSPGRTLGIRITRDSEISQQILGPRQLIQCLCKFFIFGIDHVLTRSQLRFRPFSEPEHRHSGYS
ncbi:Uncharacterized protein Fot_29618 [Forsythia ovata]|uniref:Ribosomal protein L5 n=1 Tax=Forsythia ovata TaxID=205694 RepID=A0ABD1TSD9_9LAMI